jgi:hypothetical protein
VVFTVPLFQKLLNQWIPFSGEQAVLPVVQVLHFGLFDKTPHFAGVYLVNP